jgi:hypothetical protein
VRYLPRFALLTALLLASLVARAERATDLLSLIRKDDWKAAYALSTKIAGDRHATSEERGLGAYAAFRAADVKLTEALCKRVAGKPPSAWQRLMQGVLAQMNNDVAGAEKAAKDALRDKDVAPDAHAFLIGICQIQGRLAEAAGHAQALLDAKPKGYPFDELLPQIAGFQAVYAQVRNPAKITPSRDIDVEIPLERPLGYLVVNGSINGKPPTRLILDTGGSVNPALSPTTAKELDVKPLATGAAFGFGGIEQVEVGKIDSLQVGEFRIGAQPVAIIKMLDLLTQFVKIGGVLDTRWLLSFVTTVDLDGKTLHVSDSR